MQKLLIIVGLVCLAIGLLWPLLGKLGLGNLPGDIVIKGEKTTFYFPIVSCILISILLSVIFWVFKR